MQKNPMDSNKTNANVLIVDDHSENLRFLSKILSDEGYKVRPAISGALALESIQGTKPDLILLDIKMPGMDGYEVCRQLKDNESTREIPIIFLSALDEPIDKARAFDSGGVDFISKPIQREELLARVRTHLDLHGMKTRLEQLVSERTSELIRANKELQNEITERKMTGMALKESEEKYRRLVESLEEEYFIYSHDTDGVFSYVSPSITNVLGYTQKEFLGHFTEYLTDSHITKEVKRRTELSIQGEKQPPYEVEIYQKDGSVRILEVTEVPVFDGQGNVIAVEGIAHDITERKHSELALSESDQRVELALKGADLGTWDYHVKTGLVGHDERTAEMIGYPLDEMGTNIAFWVPKVHPDDWQRYNGLFDRNFKGVTDMFEAELRIQEKSGGWKWVLTRGKVVDRDKNGNPLKVAGTIWDITEQKQIETDRANLQSKLVQVQKMEAIGTLAGGIAHDFNNVLAAIFGYSELALSQVEQGSLPQKNLQEVLEAAKRAQDLVQQILTFSRQTEQELKPIQVKLVAKEALKLLRASLPTTIKIKKKLKSNSLVMSDPTQIHQILMNLCTNAGHAMRENGGVLEVKLENVELGPEFAAIHPTIAPGPYLQLTVSDTGRGMVPEIMERIFDPFFTTKEKGEGTGMGLAVVHGIVKSHKGAMNVYSEPGKGSIFRIYFPIIETRLENAVIDEKSIPKGTERILFIDDEEPLIKLGKELLESLGYEVSTRVSSVDALELFKAHPDAFDLVITDMTMPNMTGDELAKNLLAIRSDIPVILCTGFSAEITEEKAKGMGIRGFVSKPILKKDIAEIIREVLDDK